MRNTNKGNHMNGKFKTLVGVYSCALALMSLIVPVSVLADIAQSFPDAPITQIQLIVTLPSLIAIPTGIIVSKLASRVYKKYSALFFTAFYVFAGTMPIYLHGSVGELLLSSALVGVAMGGLQNSMTTIIPDYFEGEQRGTVLGLLSTFVCLGGFIYTSAATAFGSGDWTHAFYAYFLIGIFFVLEIVCLPKGKLEPKPTKTEHVVVPREVIVLCIMGFTLYTFCQLFNSNEALLVVERGMGGTAEAGMGSSAYTLSGIVAGIIVAPLMKVFRSRRLPSRSSWLSSDSSFTPWHQRPHALRCWFLHRSRLSELHPLWRHGRLELLERYGHGVQHGAGKCLHVPWPGPLSVHYGSPRLPFGWIHHLDDLGWCRLHHGPSDSRLCVLRQGQHPRLSLCWQQSRGLGINSNSQSIVWRKHVS